MENLETALEMEVDGEGEGTPGSLKATGLMTQEVEPSGTKLIDAHKGVKNLSHLENLGTVHHLCLESVRFAFNCYQHWAQLIFHQPGEPPFTLMIREEVT